MPSAHNIEISLLVFSPLLTVNQVTLRVIRTVAALSGMLSHSVSSLTGSDKLHRGQHGD